jgi:hypothetical protein
MIGHVKGMARKIALMQTLGPDHAGTMSMMMKAAKEFEGQQGLRYQMNWGARAFASSAALDRMYRSVTGELNGVGNSLAASIFSNLRGLSAAANLGGAILGGVPGDSVTAAFAANYNGVPMLAVVQRALTEFATENADTRAAASRLLVTSQALTESLLTGNRFDDEVLPANVVGKMADFVIRSQGLARWTREIKRAFEQEFLGLIADQSAHTFDRLDPKFRGFLERYRFDAGQWDALRSTPHADINGGTFFDIDGVADRDLGDRLLGAIIDERRYAVIEGNSRTAQLAMDKRGTATGEFFRSTLQFKSFPMTMMLTHGVRLWSEIGSPAGAGRAVSFLLATTAAGAMTLQAKAIVSGRDPRDMSDPKFWAAAALAGGGAGIYGDMIGSVATKGGAGPAEIAVGPIPGQLAAGANALKSGVRGLMFDDEPSNAGAVIRTLKKWVPGSNLWYARLAIDRLIYDQIQTAVDPQYRESFRRMKKRAKDDYGQKFFWGPGDDTPSRAPDFGAAAGR